MRFRASLASGAGAESAVIGYMQWCKLSRLTMRPLRGRLINPHIVYLPGAITPRRCSSQPSVYTLDWLDICMRTMKPL